MIHLRRVLNAVADLTRWFSLAFLPPAAIAFLYEPADVDLGPVAVPHNAIVFLASTVIVLLYWFPLHLATRRVSDEELREREAYVTVGAGWIVITLFSMMPFLMSGVLTSPIDAFFEAMSGLTTTGASTLYVAPEQVPKSVLFWRALMQWIGGLGIIVLYIALIAGLTHRGLTLFQAEAAGHLAKRLRPKLVETAKLLWRIYAVVSLIMTTVFFLLFLRLEIPVGEAAYDAVYHMMTTYATGGFSSHSASIGYYNDVAVEIATVIFMLVGATNFTLLLPVATGRFKQMFRDPQWRVLMTVFLGANVAIIAMLVAAGAGPFEALRGSVFAVGTTLTGTGLVTSDFGAWPAGALIILLALMLMGGNAGSTSGAIKSIRFLIIGKVVVREIRKLLHPRAVIPVRVAGKPISEDAIDTATAFFFTYLTIWLFATVLVTAIDPALETVLDGASATASTLGNVGVGLGAVGPTGSYAVLLPSTKIILSLLMWFGRLELFTAILLFSPRTWRA